MNFPIVVFLLVQVAVLFAVALGAFGLLRRKPEEGDPADGTTGLRGVEE